MDETDDFAADLWGEDDIDEALLIEASQQVEAETIDVSKTNNVKTFSILKQEEIYEEISKLFY